MPTHFLTKIICFE